MWHCLKGFKLNWDVPNYNRICHNYRVPGNYFYRTCKSHDAVIYHLKDTKSLENSRRYWWILNLAYNFHESLSLSFVWVKYIQTREKFLTYSNLKTSDTNIQCVQQIISTLSYFQPVPHWSPSYWLWARIVCNLNMFSTWVLMKLFWTVLYT